MVCYEFTFLSLVSFYNLHSEHSLSDFEYYSGQEKPFHLSQGRDTCLSVGAKYPTGRYWKPRLSFGVECLSTGDHQNTSADPLSRNYTVPQSKARKCTK